MNDDEIIKHLARKTAKAGLRLRDARAALDKLIDAAVKVERERCADIVRSHPMKFAGRREEYIRSELAQIILDRGCEE